MSVGVYIEEAIRQIETEAKQREVSPIDVFNEKLGTLIRLVGGMHNGLGKSTRH